ncbi:hypothetical protein CALVIDRAFT_536621 [Calocera viscosa TUFC12733]|uniref:F-box domain-containing protein n=1 Tax=Calocera viscosa (strain TUFC12733) TaxID=1330018 RepID=A0A167MXM8_CALVF|nr:hypothetical protein CALVIDRAFT_536621 [Calocera viscosa TUFC12733]
MPTKKTSGSVPRKSKRARGATIKHENAPKAEEMETTAEPMAKRRKLKHEYEEGEVDEDGFEYEEGEYDAAERASPRESDAASDFPPVLAPVSVPAPTKPRAKKTASIASPVKRAKRAKRATLGENQVLRKRFKTQGRLERISQLPTELFLEICGHLSPLDVLQMARTTRLWRQTLMSRSSTPVWRAARSTIPGLPDCPEDVSEPQYAKLLFERGCSTCTAVNGPSPDLALRLRLCRNCMHESIFPARSFKSLFPKEDPSILQIVPYTHVGANTHGHETSTQYFYRPEVEKMLVESKEQEAMLDEEEYATWFEQQEAKVTRIRESAVVINNWYRQWNMSNRNDKDLIRKERRRAIESKLLELGYDKRDMVWGYPGPSSLLQDKPLTEAGWNRLRGSLEVIVAANRDARLKREKEAVQRQRQDELLSLYVILCHKGVAVNPLSASDLQDMAVYCSPAEFFDLPSVRPVWEDRSTPIALRDFPDRDVVRQEMRMRLVEIERSLQLLLRPALQEAYPGKGEEDAKNQRRDGWSFQAEADTAELEREPVEGGQLPDLNQAASVFLCATCEEPLHWPMLLQHRHVRHGRYGDYVNPERTQPFKTSMVRVSRVWIVIMQRMLEDLGLPSDAPVAQLKTPTFCGICTTHCADYNKAFSHLLERLRGAWGDSKQHDPRNKTKPMFIRVKPTPSRLRLTGQPVNKSGLMAKDLKCALCSPDRLFQLEGLHAHLKDKHHIPDAAERETHIIWPSAS